MEKMEIEGADGSKRRIDELKSEQRKSIRSFFFALVAFIAIVFVCIAWFVNNTKVNSISGLISSAGYGFELASDGSAGRDDIWISLGNLGGSQWSYQTTEENSSLVTTSGTTPYINWFMNTDSNLKNQSGSSSGMNPGSAGKLTFYVIPDHEEEELPLGFSLNMQAYRSVEESESISADKKTTVTEDGQTTSKSVTAAGDTAEKLVNGHVMFFQNRTQNISGSYVYSDWIQNGYFTKKLSSENNDANVEKVQIKVTGSDGESTEKAAYKITVYWVWPYVMGQILLPSGDDRLSGRPALVVSESDKSAIIEDMASTVTTDSGTYNKYFYDYSSLPTGSELTNISNGSAQSGFSVTTFNQISACYNKADQYIGDNVNYVVVQMIADVAQ